MSIHEQITALLDGELVDAGSVGELMHVLAVSPEKRELLVEQLAMKRRFAATAATIVPPAGADLAILRGIAAIDAGLAAAGAPSGGASDVIAPAPVAAGAGIWRILMSGAIAVVLMLAGFGAGYLVRGDVADATGAVTSRDELRSTPPSIVRTDESALAAARDSIAMLARQLATTLVSPGSRIVTTQTRPGASVAALAGNRATRRAVPVPSASSVAVAAPVAARTESEREISPTRLRASGTTRLSSAGAAIGRPGSALETSSSGALAAADGGSLGIQVGVRNNFRLSLPRVYGLAKPKTVLQDLEIIGSGALGGDGDGLLARLRVGGAFGQTQFSQVYHTNTGGEAIDTVYEQSPQPLYVRAFVAPELLRVDQFAGLLEVGGGYSLVGGFGTVGLNLEYRPADEIAIHAGVSSWMLWSNFRDAVVLSTNVNAHLGFMYGF